MPRPRRPSWGPDIPSMPSTVSEHDASRPPSWLRNRVPPDVHRASSSASQDSRCSSRASDHLPAKPSIAAALSSTRRRAQGPDRKLRYEGSGDGESRQGPALGQYQPGSPSWPRHSWSAPASPAPSFTSERPSFPGSEPPLSLTSNPAEVTRRLKRENYRYMQDVKNLNVRLAESELKVQQLEAQRKATEREHERQLEHFRTKHQALYDRLLESQHELANWQASGFPKPHRPEAPKAEAENTYRRTLRKFGLKRSEEKRPFIGRAHNGSVW